MYAMYATFLELIYSMHLYKWPDYALLCYLQWVNGFQKKTKVLCLSRDFGFRPVVHSHRTGMQYTNPQMSNQFCWERCGVITVLVDFRKFTKWAWTLLNYQDIPIGQMDVSVTWSYYTKWSPYHWLLFFLLFVLASEHSQ